MDAEEFIKHHGIKGMHWGVRRNLHPGEGHISRGAASAGKSSGRSASTATNEAALKSLATGIEKLNHRDKAVLKAAGMSPLQAEAMRAKYGPESAKSEHKGLTSTQKKLIVAGVGLGALVALSAYGSAKEKGALLDELEKSLSPEEIAKFGGSNSREAAKAFLKARPEEAQMFGGLVKQGVKAPTARYMVESDLTKLTHTKGLAKGAAEKLSREDLEFPAGHVFKRVSTEVEREIRPDGFFASHNDADTERYKAVLPVYWKMWGMTNKSGFVNHYAADTPLKIASEGNMYDLIKSHLDEPIGGAKAIGSGRMTLRQIMSGNNYYANDDALMNKKFYDTIANFADRNDPVTVKLAELFKEAGYHGIVDANDAGSLSAQPVKLLDGTIFKIIGHESLSAEQISAAQNAIVKIMHGGIMSDDVAAFLQHHGVKGMHWGVHKARADAEEFAKAKLAYGEGAGTRRKLIKAKVAERSKNPEYKAEFEKHLAKQDMSKLAKQAKVNHRTKSAVKSTAKTARGVHRQLTGGFGAVSLASAGIAGAYVAAKKTGLDQVLVNQAKNQWRKRQNYKEVADWLKDQNVY